MAYKTAACLAVAMASLQAPANATNGRRQYHQQQQSCRFRTGCFVVAPTTRWRQNGWKTKSNNFPTTTGRRNEPDFQQGMHEVNRDEGGGGHDRTCEQNSALGMARRNHEEEAEGENQEEGSTAARRSMGAGFKKSITSTLRFMDPPDIAEKTHGMPPPPPRSSGSRGDSGEKKQKNSGDESAANDKDEDNDDDDDEDKLSSAYYYQDGSRIMKDDLPNDTRYSASDWLHNVKTLPNSSILQETSGPVSTIFGWSCLVSLVFHLISQWKTTEVASRIMCIPTTPHSFLVSALGLLLVFRTNSAYQRFAEGRTIWEKILSVSRNMSRMTFLYSKELGRQRKQRIQRLLASFPYLLQHHIKPQCLKGCPPDATTADLLLLDEPRRRPSSPFDTLDPFESLASISSSSGSSDAFGTSSPSKKSKKQKKAEKDDPWLALSMSNAWRVQQKRFLSGLRWRSRRSRTNDTTPCWVDRRTVPWCLLPAAALAKCASCSNRPLWICDRLAQEFTQVSYTVNFTSRERLAFLSQVDQLSKAIGECERIHQTAVPLNYARHSLRSLTIWLFSLPFALVKDLGLLTGPVMAVISWILFGVYQIGYTIEDPFQGTLRLSTLCDAIYRDVMFDSLDRLGARRETAFDIAADEKLEWTESLMKTQDEYQSDEDKEQQAFQMEPTVNATEIAMVSRATPPFKEA